MLNTEDAKSTKIELSENEISGMVVDAAYKVHKKLGPGLLESVYETCLTYELEKLGLEVSVQKNLPVIDNIELDCAYRLDIYVERKVIVEIKTVDNLANIHIAQMLTYLRLANCRVGLLLNFNVTMLKDGIKRIVNG